MKYLNFLSLFALPTFLITLLLLVYFPATITFNIIDNQIEQCSIDCTESDDVSLCNKQCEQAENTFNENLKVLKFFDFDGKTLAIWLLSLAIIGFLISLGIKRLF